MLHHYIPVFLRLTDGVQTEITCFDQVTFVSKDELLTERHFKDGQFQFQFLMKIARMVSLRTADSDFDLEDQDHLKQVILKMKITSPKQSDLKDRDHAYLCIHSLSRSHN